jgi:peroxiredoxin
MPARFVIDRAGIIRAADVDPDYTVRPEPEATVAVLKTLV